ncbi:MAG: hypothetical protein B7X06_01925 [Verrucomicrobia bacterium 21-51-4]|nr:MAG: hypothetical protein B7X06_01925 [Verrucomicrobia bacterium 21-51-4]HQU08638.1 crossover junction endodeoxyribonuclease RuvC [Opitutales bacterium]
MSRTRTSTRALWTAQLTGKASVKKAAMPQLSVQRKCLFEGIVIGIDPSLRGTGLACVEFKANRSVVLHEYTCVKIPPKVDMYACLGQIYGAVQAFMQKYPTGHVAVEQTIYVQNFQVAQTLGAARGAALAAANLRGWPIFEYAPLRIKQAVVGFGRASKEQMIKTVGQLFATQAVLLSDEADAAAVALCHGFTYAGD